MSEVKEFCIKSCPLGLEKRKEFLDKNNSVYDAATDMYFFVKECMKTCPYKEDIDNE